ncbi:hypothetical protein HYFRA_00002875 [Hymenoscyphus fraxineus]|uniref:Peptidase S54 rhomboid domain-containing protein n=1 Tax=Hymenoscyphus fraxineus TaxID=746836 RepID=A0A9N9KMR7_9HELO|nr:hypothetical protein HYFRA_00002875 [Hymenoscyphus fraxineus]
MTTNLWSPASRSLCLNSRPLFQTCYKIDSLAARLAQRHARSITHSSVSQGLKGPRSCGLSHWSREAHGTGLSFARQTATRSFAAKSMPIVTEYHQLPKNYDPKTGLRFRDTPLTKNEVIEIFGKGVDPIAANRLLKLLHGHRVAGTLEDPSSITTVPGIKRRQMELGLEWLRKTVPVNEVASAGLRAEEELAAMGEKVIATISKTDKWEPNKNTPKDQPYGNGVLNQRIEMNKEAAAKEAAAKAAAREQEEKEREEAMLNNPEAISQNTNTSLDAVRPQVTMETYEGGDGYKKWLARARLTNTDQPPEMTIFQRLWPSALALLGTLAASFTFVAVYTPPKNSARLFPDIPPSAATVGGLILLSAAVLFAWRIPPLWRYLNKYFIVVSGYPYALSNIASIISHQGFKHYAFNMVVLWLMGTKLHDEIGRANFLAVFLCTGVFANFASLAVTVGRGILTQTSLGASGAVMGVAATYLLLNSDSKIEFWRPPEERDGHISAMGLFGILVLVEILALGRAIRTGTPEKLDHFAHLGGYLGGAVSSQLLRSRLERRKAVEKERREKLGLVEGIQEGVVRK